jgi:hypothetical protein
MSAVGRKADFNLSRGMTALTKADIGWGPAMSARHPLAKVLSFRSPAAHPRAETGR